MTPLFLYGVASVLAFRLVNFLIITLPNRRMVRRKIREDIDSAIAADGLMRSLELAGAAGFIVAVGMTRQLPAKEIRAALSEITMLARGKANQ